MNSSELESRVSKLESRDLESRVGDLEKLVDGLGEYLYRAGSDLTELTGVTPEDGKKVKC